MYLLTDARTGQKYILDDKQAIIDVVLKHIPEDGVSNKTANTNIKTKVDLSGVFAQNGFIVEKIEKQCEPIGSR